MGFFSKKKNDSTPASVLSENEIQKKLYGEFYTGASHVVTGEREHLREPASPPVPPRELSKEKEEREAQEEMGERAEDLFSAQKDALIHADPPSRRALSGSKPVDPASRHVPLHDFEKSPLSSASFASDPYARFRHNRPPENKMASFLKLLKWFFGKGMELFKVVLDPQQVALRRIFYWGVAALVVFLLFWGVNALNSQREVAMRTRYKIPAEAASVPVAVQAPSAVQSSGPTAERSVVITPAPIRPKGTMAADGRKTTAASATGTYVIQVVTYPTRQDADQVVAAFRRVGLRAYVKENTRPSGRLFYLVLIGGFRNEAEAQAQLLKFRAKEVARPFQDAFVKSSRS